MRARNPNEPPLVPVCFRLPPHLLKRLDKYVEILSRSGAGLRYTRTDALKLLVGEALTQKGLPERSHS
jgi:hypothetical protein